MDTPRFELIFMNTGRSGESIPLDKPEIVAGRSGANLIVIEDSLVSRQHLRIKTVAGVVLIEDMDSSHGTFLNDKRIRGTVSLNDGDMVQLGGVRLRFAVRQETDGGDRTVFVDHANAEPMKSRATEFADVSGGSETRFMPADKPSPEDSSDKTRILDEGATRLMDRSELKGLKAAPSRPGASRRFLPAAILVLLVPVAAAALLLKGYYTAPGACARPGIRSNKQYGFSIGAPTGWTPTERSDGVIAYEHTTAMNKPDARMTVYADTSPDNALSGLQTGFEAYKEVLATRYPGMKVQAKKMMAVNDANTVFFTFRSGTEGGKGIFTLSGNNRLCVVCSAPLAACDSFAQTFTTILRTFRLNEPQQFIDFPPPPDDLRRKALSEKEKVSTEAEKDLEIGRELLRHGSVRPENLYLAGQTLERCLMVASALIERPAFFAEAAARLADATKALDGAVRDLKFEILAAEREHDFKRAYWQAQKLTQTAPDKTSEANQFGARRMERYSKMTMR